MTNLAEDASQFYEDFSNFDSTTILTISLLGLVFTLIFIYYYRHTLIESYGNKVYLWFVFLISLNLLNLVYISGYHRSKVGTLIGKPGPSGSTGIPGKRGEDLLCGYCNVENEIGIQYSNDYNLIGRVQKTTNLLGELSIWRAKGSLGTAPLGDTVFARHMATKIKTYIAGYGSKKPTGFSKIISLTDGVKQISFWKAEAPEGFAFLGHFVTIGAAAPDTTVVAGLPTKCLVVNSKGKYNYVASFPAIDIIPLNGGGHIDFCSFWATPLNHFRIKVSGALFHTQSVYFNIVDGHKKYYNYKTRRPIPEKAEELKKLLQGKVSVIYHHPTESGFVKFHAPFVQNVRNHQGKIVSYKIHAKEFEDFLGQRENQTLEAYIELYRQALNYIYKIIKSSRKPVHFVHQSGSSQKSALRSLELKLKEAKNDAHAMEEINKFIKTIQSNSTGTFSLLQNETNAAGSKQTLQFNRMNLTQKQEAFNKALIALSSLEISKLLKKLRSRGIYPTESAIHFFGDDPLMETVRNYRKMGQQGGFKASVKDEEKDTSGDGQIAQFQFLNLQNNQKQKADLLIESKDREVNPNLTLWDDLVYLFPFGLDHQIAKTADDQIEGGIYLDAPENRQKRYFINYLRTFIPPNEPIYFFRRKCMMFTDLDEDRAEVIQEIKKAYNFLGRQLTNLNAFQNCDDDQGLIRIYQNMMHKIDRQFKSIPDYKDKLKNQEFSYFPTGRLKWLLSELNVYHLAIKSNCKSGERTRLITKIRLFKDRLSKNFDYLVDLKPHQSGFEIEDFVKKVTKLDFIDFSLRELRKLLKIFQNELIKVAKNARDNSSEGRYGKTN